MRTTTPARNRTSAKDRNAGSAESPVTEEVRQAPAGPTGKLLLTVDEAASQLGISRTLMYRLVSSGAVESVTVGRLRRVPSECLGDYVTELRRSQAKSALASILDVADRGLPDGKLDSASLDDLQTAVAWLRSSLSGGQDAGDAQDSAA